MTRIQFLIFLLFLTNSSFAQKENKERQLDSIFSMLNEQNQFSGTVLIAEKGNIVFEKAYGYSNEDSKKKNDTRTIYELASCSKQFTAAAIVLLKRQGKINYEDKISKYFPEFIFWDKVTIYDLLHHTSGLPEFLADMSKEWNPDKIATNDDLIDFYASRKDTLQFEPKSRHRYCNTNYVLLASIVERISGKTYADFLVQNIFKPLKMKHTFVYCSRLSRKEIKNYATGYVWSRNSLKKIKSEQPGYGEKEVYFLDGILGTSKVQSNVDDIYKWVTALKNNTLFTQEEFDEMTKITQTSAGKDIQYGFGLMMSKGENKFTFGHNGSWDGYVSFIHHDVIKDRTIIILQNFKLGVFPYNNIVQVIESQPVKMEFRKRIMLPESDIQKYAGIYTDSENKENVHALTFIDGHLFYNTTKQVWDMRFFPVGKNEFVGLRQGSSDSILKFTELENGDIQLEMLQSGTIIGRGTKKKS